MITKRQFAELNILKRDLGRLEKFKREFKESSVWLDVGVVEINSASRNDPKINQDQSRFFHNEFVKVKDRFKESLLEEIDIKIKAIKNKMSLYLTDEE